MFSNNKIQLGPLWSANAPSTQLFLNGDAYFNCYPAIGGFSFLNYQNTFGGNTYNDPALIPQHSNGMWLGNSTKLFYRIYANEIYANQPLVVSDENLKTNIRSFSGDSALSKILQLNAYSYDLKADTTFDALDTCSQAVKEARIARLTNLNKNQIGLMAQQIKTLIPEAVKIDEVTGKHAVNYTMLIPLLIESLKKQQEQINSLKQEIELLKN